MSCSLFRRKDYRSVTGNVYIAETLRRRSVNAGRPVTPTLKTNNYLSRVQCVPIDRKWPGKKCDRCDELSLPCSDNHRAGEAFRQSISVPTALTSSSFEDLERLYILWQVFST